MCFVLLLVFISFFFLFYQKLHEHAFTYLKYAQHSFPHDIKKARKPALDFKQRHARGSQNGVERARGR